MLEVTHTLTHIVPSWTGIVTFSSSRFIAKSPSCLVISSRRDVSSQVAKLSLRRAAKSSRHRVIESFHFRIVSSPSCQVVKSPCHRVAESSHHQCQVARVSHLPCRRAAKLSRHPSRRVVSLPRMGAGVSCKVVV
jgi:hypothetical protein